MEILLVDDERPDVKSLQELLEEGNPSGNITVCSSTEQAYLHLNESGNFDMVVCDLLTPSIDGIEFMKGLKNLGIATPVVFIISGSEQERNVLSAIKYGAQGFIVRTLPPAELTAGMKIVADGGTFFPDRFSNVSQSTLAVGNPSLAVPTGSSLRIGLKQLNVLKLMAAGNSNKQISRIAGITEATVKYHSSQLFKLLDVKNRTSCVLEAQRRGLL